MERSYFARICVLATFCACASGAARAGSAWQEAEAVSTKPLVARAALDFRVTVHASMALRIDSAMVRVQGSGAPLVVQGLDGPALATVSRRGLTDVRYALPVAADTADAARPGITLASP